MKSVVWEMEEAMGSALEVCLDAHIVVTHGCVALRWWTALCRLSL